MGHLSHGPANRGRRVLQTAAPLFVREPWSGVDVRGGVVVLHDVLGVTDLAEDVCRRLARDGRLAVSPYLYYERGGPAFDTAELAVARREMERLRGEDLAADIDGAISYLKGRGVSRVAVAGFSMGGYLATWAAAHLDVAAAVAVSPSGAGAAPWDGLPPLEKLLPEVRAPWLGVIGERDPQALAAAPEGAVVTVPGAAHGFYREGVDPALWERISAFLGGV
ncbi:dienelactone hydrolase family protein [Actinomadura sp. 21ATH]|uniref:dienelactone hydrolase family protein n=1 Tax=Actinomadura sp. 21ATH TaxID=1735444 RepID=UPI0035C0A549